MTERLLLVGQTPLVADPKRNCLREAGYVVDSAYCPADAIDLVRTTRTPYSLVIIHRELAVETVSPILRERPDSYILLLVDDIYPSPDLTMWPVGAIGIAHKSAERCEFLESVRDWCRKYSETHSAIRAFAQQSQSELVASLGLVGRSGAMDRVAAKIVAGRASSRNILVVGETGTERREVACALRGAALLFDSATCGGTRFLENLEKLSPADQREVAASLRPQSASAIACRVISTAGPELGTQVATGSFSAELYRVLNGFEIAIPPLRERTEDIELWTAYFCRRYEENTGEPRHFSRRTLRYFEAYPWPRNVRELEQTVLRLCAASPTAAIVPEYLDGRFFRNSDREAIKGNVDPKRDRVLRREISDAVLKTSSRREAARRLGIPETSFRRLIKRLAVGKTENLRP